MTFTFERLLWCKAMSCRGALRLGIVHAAAGLLAATAAVAGPGTPPVMKVNTSSVTRSSPVYSAELPGDSLGNDALRSIAGKGGTTNSLRPINGVAVILWDEARTGRPKPSAATSQGSNAQYAPVPVVRVYVVQPK